MFTSQNQPPNFAPPEERERAPVTKNPATRVPHLERVIAPDEGSRSAYVQGFASPMHRHSVAEDREVVLDVTPIQIPQVLNDPK
jgi:hypothetical protein